MLIGGDGGIQKFPNAPGSYFTMNPQSEDDCCGSCGQIWCEEEAKCYRPFEEPCGAAELMMTEFGCPEGCARYFDDWDIIDCIEKTEEASVETEQKAVCLRHERSPPNFWSPPIRRGARGDLDPP